MNRFAELLDRLVLTPSRNGKLKLLADYFRDAPDPDRGLALAAHHRRPAIAAVKPAMLRALVAERMDPVLFGYSYDYVGDLAETVSLVWPDPPAQRTPSRRADARRGRRAAAMRPAAPTGRTCWRGLLDSAGIDGALRPHQAGHRRLAHRRFGAAGQAGAGRFRQGRRRRDRGALARAEAALCRRCSPGWKARRDKPEQAAHGAVPPGHAVACRSRTATSKSSTRPTMPPSGNGTASACRRCRKAASARLYSRTGDDISGAFPDLVEAMDFDGALDGELLVGDPLAARPARFSDLQQRLNRKTVSPKMQRAVSRPSSAATTSCRSATRTCAPCPSPSGASGWKPSSRRSTRRASTCRRSSPFADWAGARRDAQQRRRIRSSKA